MSQSLSTEALIESVLGAMAQASFAEVTPDSSFAIQAFTSASVAEKPQTPRVVVTASLRSDDQSARIGSSNVRIFDANVTIEVPPSDTTLPPDAYRAAIGQMVETLVSPTPAMIAAIDADELSAFDLFVIESASGSDPAVDNDRISYTAQLTVIAHRRF